MTDEQKVIHAMNAKFEKVINEQEAKDLLEKSDIDTILNKIKGVDDEFAKTKAYNPVGLIIVELNKPDKSKRKKQKMQEPDETIVEEYNRMVEEGIITADEKFQLLQKSASREVKFVVAKNQYPHHSRLWGRAAGLDVNQMVVFCELDPLSQENPDWDWIDQETERRTIEFKRAWDAGEITPQTISDQLGFNPIAVAREMDTVPF